jgi:hypothetical protein
MAWQRGCGLGASPTTVIGAAVTASLRSRTPKRGQHRIVVAVHCLNATSVASIVLEKEARSRADEETLATALLLEGLAKLSPLITALANPATPLPDAKRGDAMQMLKQHLRRLEMDENV